MEGNSNLVVAFVKWWYGEAYRQLFVFIKRLLAYNADLFSVKICITTLVEPWKRDQMSTEGLALQDKFQVWIMNASSRFIGAMVKIVTLGTFLGVFLVAALTLTGFALIWLMCPVVSVGLIIYGLRLVGN